MQMLMVTFFLSWMMNFLFRFALSSMDMGLRDYDSRSALHIAAAEGELHILPVCKRKKKKPFFSTDAVIVGHFNPKTAIVLICPRSVFKIK